MRRRIRPEYQMVMHKGGYTMGMAFLVASTALAAAEHHVWVAAIAFLGLCCMVAGREDG
jgi:hypothetical protein